MGKKKKKFTCEKHYKEHKKTSDKLGKISQCILQVVNILSIWMAFKFWEEKMKDLISSKTTKNQFLGKCKWPTRSSSLLMREV